MTDNEALKILEDLIESWTSINNRFSKDINAHSLCIGENQMEGLKICAARLKEKSADQEKQNENKAGWQTHPGTHCGHYFPEGEIKSLCNRERRASGDTLDDCTIKCTVCQKRVGEPRTVNLFAAMD